MHGFNVIMIAEGIYRILDAGENTFYVVVGEDKAAVIDTGISPRQKIRPEVEKLTDKELILIVTHAHVDHFHHMDEFETVYMCHDEFKMPAAELQNMKAGKNLDLEGTIDIKTDDVIDIGGEQLEICQVPGHTPGHVVVLAKKANILFSGDSIGSGRGAWLQVPSCLPLTEYKRGLEGMLAWLVARGGRMKFFAGHYTQQFSSTAVPGYNPLGIGVLADMIDLVDGIIKGEIVGHPTNEIPSFGMEPAYYASYGRAEIQYLRSRIR